MRCDHCKVEINDDSKVCPVCNNIITSTSLDKPVTDLTLSFSSIILGIVGIIWVIIDIIIHSIILPKRLEAGKIGLEDIEEIIKNIFLYPILISILTIIISLFGIFYSKMYKRKISMTISIISVIVGIIILTLAIMFLNM